MIRRFLSLIPAPVRRAAKIQQRLIADIQRGYTGKFVTKKGARDNFPVQKELTQRISPGATLEAKLHNMRKAIALLHGLTIAPGQILSFWEVVGNPGKRQGFLPGRNIVNGQLVEDYGGGLCQLTAAMYELALRAGLHVVERHAHSTNVYTPETSYTSLGLDATLAFGYKDLRISNTLDFPLHFSFALSTEQIRVGLCAEASLPEIPIRVVHQTSEKGLVAQVFQGEAGEEREISKDFYRAWKG